MAATKNVHQHPQSHNSLAPRQGILTLFGYGIQVCVDRGHLFIEDGIGTERHRCRLPRVGHGLKRLVVIGSDGVVSLAAFRWLADQNAAFVMLERDGHVLATTGPVRSSDARLRRAQALAEHSGVALSIARELIGKKLAGQEQVVRDKLLDSATADVIAGFRIEVDQAETMDTVRAMEAQGAAAYWAVWRDLPICFPKNDLRRVPQHWRIFGTRKSPLSGSQRLAVNPPNAILNYLYAVLESEARLAAAAVGLDPGLGVLHNDAPARDSLACDLMEPIRPQVDAWLLDWITRQALMREWFFEQNDGNCRLMGSFAAKLSETATTWGRAVAPYAEWTTRTLWSRRRADNGSGPATHLTQQRRREAKGSATAPRSKPAPHPSVCRTCGTSIPKDARYCGSCAVPAATEQVRKISQLGRAAGREKSHAAEAHARRAETQRQHTLARWAWRKSNAQSSINEKSYLRDIQPRLAALKNAAISGVLGVSIPYASAIRAGKRRPHPRHWQALAQLAGITDAH
jgi:CRISPR-associated endonuclease Cas1